MELTASTRRGGRAGSKASRLRFSQPSGAVTTTSSKEIISPEDVRIWTLLLLPAAACWYRIVCTTVLSLISAFSTAGLAMASRILRYVLAQKSVSEGGWSELGSGERGQVHGRRLSL